VRVVPSAEVRNAAAPAVAGIAAAMAEAMVAATDYAAVAGIAAAMAEAMVAATDYAAPFLIFSNIG
jgi:hypothetical protein